MKLGKILGVNLKVHYLFLLWLVLGLTLGETTKTLAMLFSVIVHEMGHLFAAHGMGQQVDEILLMPFGGVAKLKGFLTGDPKEEATLALAGPLNSLVLLGLGIMNHRTLWGAALLESNVLLLMANLLPVLPLDGGRILRSHLVAKEGLAQGTRKALVYTFRVAWGFLCLQSILFLLGAVSLNALALSLFLLYAAWQEKKMLPYMVMNYVARGAGELWPERILPGKLVMVKPDTAVVQAVETMTPGFYHVFNIVRPGGEIMALSQDKIYQALIGQGAKITFADIMNERRI